MSVLAEICYQQCTREQGVTLIDWSLERLFFITCVIIIQRMTLVEELFSIPQLNICFTLLHTNE